MGKRDIEAGAPSRCPACGGPLPERGARRCPECGRPLPHENVALGAVFDRGARRIDAAAALRTARAIYLRPFGTFRVMAPEGSVLDAVLFAAILGLPSLWLYWLELWIGGRASASAFLAGALLSGPLFPAVLVIWSAVIHMVLQWTGRGRRPLPATFRAIAFALGGSMPLWVIPVIGPSLALIGFLWFQLVAAKEFHGIRLGDAALSVLPPAAVMAGVGILVALFVAAHLLGRSIAEGGA